MNGNGGSPIVHSRFSRSRERLSQRNRQSPSIICAKLGVLHSVGGTENMINMNGAWRGRCMEMVIAKMTN